MGKGLDIMNEVAKHVQKREKEKSHKKYSEKAEEVISHKMEKMHGEDKPQDQKVAIALSEAREKGLKVPKKK